VTAELGGCIVDVRIRGGLASEAGECITGVLAGVAAIEAGLRPVWLTVE